MSDYNPDLSHEDMDHGMTCWIGILDFGSEVYNAQTASGVNQEPFLMHRDLGAQDVVSNIHVYLVPATAISLVEPQGDTLKITIEQGGC
ncbi:hypothetical protein [Luteolibacter luteus]|uniref:Uncharacterized protein n=1 Tax=Luteolibacter luteus TaxID=2728835 RepID=A0A858RF11_9BACT|nr:hypothetical protein [Luteolibacter luteus]QJE94890.1 hypothetical protein HHL09_03545 [Luteolibacter luteus]